MAIIGGNSGGGLPFEQYPEAHSRGKKRTERDKPEDKRGFTQEKQGRVKRQLSGDSSGETLSITSSPIVNKVATESISNIAKEMKFLEKQTISLENLPRILELGSRLQNDTRYKKLANRMLKNAKAFISEHPHQYAIQAAANKGKAAVAGLQAVAATLGKGQQLEPNVKSAQEVVLLPQHGAVLKRMDALAKEETRLVDSLFELLSKKSVVGTFDMKGVRYEAKPFVEMFTVAELKKVPKVLEKVLCRLEPDSIYNALLTGEIQLLDLHRDNLGITCVLPEKCERFSGFSLPPEYNENMSIKDFIVKCLAGDISDETQIRYTEEVIRDGKKVLDSREVALQDLPQELKEALSCPWKLVIFDTDIAIAEDNLLQVQIADGNKEHLIPLRNCLLETAWKDWPLPAETIDRMLQSKDQAQKVQAWVQRQDAPILKQLSAKNRQHLQKLVAPRIEAYSLRQIRSKEGADRTTINDLRKVFVKDLCENTRQNRKIWTFLEKNLRMADIARYDLTSNSLEARIKRNAIAEQLFPRLTFSQQEALFERQAKKMEYVERFQEFARSESRNNHLLDEMENYLLLPETPLNSVRKQELLQKVASLRQLDETTFFGGLSAYVWGSKEDQIAAVKNTILQECRPTFFNVMKAMYPMLADVYELTKAVYGEAKAGSSIGYFGVSIEGIIAAVRNQHRYCVPLIQLADKVERQINEAKNPSFFLVVKNSPTGGDQGSSSISMRSASASSSKDSSGGVMYMKKSP